MKLKKKAQMRAGALWVGAITASASLLAACGASRSQVATGSAKDVNKPVTLSVLLERDTGPSVVEAKQRHFLQNLTREFEHKWPYITLHITTYPGSPATVIDTMVASHRGPNVIEVGTTFIPTLSATGAFVPWTKTMLREVGISDIVPAATRMDGVPGQLPVGVPDSAQPFCLWYNKGMLAAAGIKAPPSTWSEFISDAEKLNQPSKGVYGAGIAPADPFYSMHVTWLLARQNGGEVINASGTKAEFASESTQKEIKFYLEWLTKFHVVSPADVQYQESDLIAAFVAGKVAMVPVGGLYDLGQIDATASKAFLANDLGVAPNPVIPYGDSATPPGGLATPSFVSGQEQAIFKYGTSPAQIAAAIKWLRFYTSPLVQEQLPKLYGTLPVNKDAYGAKYLRTQVWKEFEHIEADSAPTPQVAGWLDLPTVYDKAMATVFDDAALGKYHKGELRMTLERVDAQLDTTLASLSSGS